MPRTWFGTIRFALACLLILAAPAAAQQQPGAVQGAITDDTHAVLPSVTITVTHLATGTSINNGPWGGTVRLVPKVEAVQEFQVIANNPSAEYGRNSGAIVSVITEGGRIQLSGSVFEFHRDQSLRSSGFFETKNAPITRNDYGGSLGGPIKERGGGVV